MNPAQHPQEKVLDCGIFLQKARPLLSHQCATILQMPDATAIVCGYRSRQAYPHTHSPWFLQFFATHQNCCVLWDSIWAVLDFSQPCKEIAESLECVYSFVQPARQSASLFIKAALKARNLQFSALGVSSLCLALRQHFRVDGREYI